MSAAPDRAQIVDRLLHLAAAQVGVDPAGVTADTHLFNDLDFDSLEAVEFIMQIEDEFEVSIPDEQADEAKTVGQAADILLGLMGAPRHSDVSASDVLPATAPNSFRPRSR